MIPPDELKQLARKYAPEFESYYKKNKKRLEKMDEVVHDLHDRISDGTDCLQCAGCCKQLGPAITDKDIDRLARALKIRPSEVVMQYLKIDEDRDYVFRSLPCPFLMPDNYCSVYESRPKACREYPHTDRKKFAQIYKLTVKNAETCPVAFEVLRELLKTGG